ncbi:hypothetical protein ACH5RR_012498 [Cinchona calisaya]|uniref:Uncharacterized protein n=1 Tax=Cinchona calisaya TaxID=153742 RepID=A0ABD3AAJ0_9GENT
MQQSTIQAVTYTKDVAAIDRILEAYCLYYIGNASVSKITQQKFQFATSSLQLTLTGRTFIRQIEGPKKLFLIYILCAVVNVLPGRTMPRDNKQVQIQEFVIVNDECKPVIFTMWEEFLDSYAAQLVDVAPTFPIILIITQVKNYCQAYTPIPQAAELQNWVKGNCTYIEKSVPDRLYEREHQTIETPAENQF